MVVFSCIADCFYNDCDCVFFFLWELGLMGELFLRDDMLLKSEFLGIKICEIVEIEMIEMWHSCPNVGFFKVIKTFKLWQFVLK